MTLIAVTSAGMVDSEAVSCAELTLGRIPGVETLRIDPFPDPGFAYDPARRQYSSTLILRDCIARRPPGAARLLVLMEQDIFIPMLSFVYGQAQLDGPVAVVSLARLRQEFYSLAPNRALFLLRVSKETQHEIGHTFGLTHCDDPLCTMTLSTNIYQLDFKQADYCSDCTVLLSEGIGHAGGTAAESEGA